MLRFHVYHARDCASNTNVLQPPGLITGVETYASLLKAARKAADLTQGELAKKAGVSQGTVGNIESHARDPQVDSLAKLAFALDLLVDDLIPGAGRARALRILRDAIENQNPTDSLGITPLVKQVSATKVRRAPVVAWARLGVVLLTKVRGDLADAEHLPVVEGTPPDSVWAEAEADQPRFGIKRGRKLLFAPVLGVSECEENEVHLFMMPSGVLVLGELRRLAGDGYEAIPDSGPPLDSERHGIKVIAAMLAIYR